MKLIAKIAIATACATFIGTVGGIQSSWAQQQQSGTTATPQTAPAPGPAMGQPMMQQGMEHDKKMEGMGHGGMGSGMAPQPGTTQQATPDAPAATPK